MERQVNFILIGSLSFFIVIMFVAFLLWFGRIDIGDDKIKKYYIYTEHDISGIALRTPVKYKGIIIGNVAKISFDKNNIGLVKITLTINKEIPIREGSTLIMDSQGLVGMSYLSLHQNPDGKIIDDSSEARLVLEKNFMGNITNQVDKIATGITEVLNKQNINDITQAINSLSAFAVRLDAMSDSIDTIVKSTANIAKNLDRKFQEGQYDLAPTLNQAQRSLQNLDAVLQKGSNILDKFNDNPYKTLFGEH